MVEKYKGEKLLQQSGEIVGKSVKPFFDFWMRKELRNFEVIYHDIEKLTHINGPYIIACNHVAIPISNRALSGLSPDTHIIANLVHDKLKRNMHVVGLSDVSTNAELKDTDGTKQAFILQNLHTGLLRGFGHFPFKDPKSPSGWTSLRPIYAWIERQIIQTNSVLLLYPAGKWASSFDPNDPLLYGIGHFAMKFNIPIIPAYIVGCDRWDVPSHTPVHLYFGDVIEPPKEPKRVDLKRIVLETGNAIMRMQQNHFSSNLK